MQEDQEEVFIPNDILHEIFKYSLLSTALIKKKNIHINIPIAGNCSHFHAKWPFATGMLRKSIEFQ